MVDEKILQSDCLRTFWPISQEQKFSQTGNLEIGNTVNIYFHYRTISVNINDQIFQKTLFLAHFPNFWDKKLFLENPALSCTTSYGFLAPYQNLEKTYDTIPKKHLDRRKGRQKERRKDGQKDRQTLFYRTLPATAGRPIKKHTVNVNCAFGLCFYLPLLPLQISH